MGLFGCPFPPLARPLEASVHEIAWLPENGGGVRFLGAWLGLASLLIRVISERSPPRSCTASPPGHRRRSHSSPPRHRSAHPLGTQLRHLHP